MGARLEGPPVRVEAVFFDAAGTLLYADPPVGEVYACALREAGVNAEGAEVQMQFERAWHRIRHEQPPNKLPYGSTEAEAMRWWRRVVRESFRPFGLPATFEEVFLHLWTHFSSAAAWRLYDDVLPTFGDLERRGKGIGLISNWDTRLFGLLDQMRLRPHMRWTVVSSEVGVEKPHAEIFARALKECGLPAQKAVHVGDSYEEDVVGALRAGMQAVWLRRSDAHAAAPDGVTVIRSLTELSSVLE